MWATVKAMVFSTYANPQAKRALKEESKKAHGPRAHLVQLGLASDMTESGELVGAGSASGSS